MRQAFVIALWLTVTCACQSLDDGGEPGAGDAGGHRAGAQAGNGGGAGESEQAPGGGDGGQESCAAPSGSYMATYTARSGNCGELGAPFSFTFDGRRGAATLIQHLPATVVTTDVELEGCALRVTQTVEDTQGEQRQRVVAELSIDASGAIAGTATVTRFEAGAVACTGEYALELRRNTTIIGENPGGEDATPDAGGGSDSADSGLPEDVRTKVEYDCNQTLQCQAQQGTDLPPDALAACIDQTSRLLAADADTLAGFLEAFAICEPFVVCDYVNCSTPLP